MRGIISLLILISILFVLVSCSTNNSSESSNQKSNDVTTLTISAAVSLTEALGEIKELFEKDRDIHITYNLGGSGTLAQQIQQGAPTDIFISANEDWMDILENENLIMNGTRATITGNQLVLITNKTSPITYDAITDIAAEDVDQLAIGNPNSVPAGKYTEEVLSTLQKWDELKSKFVLAKDVRQVLTYVETGNAELGFVYESDAKSSEQIKVIATADEDLHDPIIYPAAVIKDTKHAEEAVEFIQFMESEAAQNIFVKYGFRK